MGFIGPDLETSLLTYLGKKTALLERYMSITAELMEASRKKRTWESESLVIERERLTQAIDTLDRSHEERIAAFAERPDSPEETSRKAVLEGLESMRRTLAEADRKDKELNLLVKEESESLRCELLKFRAGRSAAHRYGEARGTGPRFLDTRK